MSSRIDTLVQAFVTELRAAIAAEAAAAFAIVAGGGGQPDPLLRAKGRTGPKPRVLTSAPKAKVAQGKRARRTQEDIDAQKSSILGFVKRHPGSKAEAIGKELGMTSLEMQIPIGQLKAEKKLATKGSRRATIYTAK